MIKFKIINIEMMELFFIILGFACVGVLHANHLLAFSNEQNTLYASYAESYAKLAELSDRLIVEWMPYVAGGGNSLANLPLPLSLTRVFASLIGDGSLGVVAAEVFMSVAAGLFLFLFLKTIKATQACILISSVIYAVSIKYLSIEESHPMILLTSVFYFSIRYTQVRKPILLLAGAVCVGGLLNNHVAQGAATVLALHGLFILAMRKDLPFSSHVLAAGVIWTSGICFALPTLLPQIADLASSSKTVTPRGMSGGLTGATADFIYAAALNRFKLLEPLLIVSFWAAPLYWNEVPFMWRRMLICGAVLAPVIILFSLLQAEFAVVGILDSVLKAVDTIRFSFTFRFLVIVTVGISFGILFRLRPPEPMAWRSLLIRTAISLSLLAAYLLPNTSDLPRILALYAVTGGLLLAAPHVRFVPGKMIVFCLGCLAVVYAYRIHDIGPRLGFSVDWVLFSPDARYQSLFPDESAEMSDKMTAFLRSAFDRDMIQTADLRDLRPPSGIFQTYPGQEISTINGFLNIKPLRAHRFYLWLLDDLRETAHEDFKWLRGWGSFGYSFGSRYKTHLLHLAGVRYLIAPITLVDSRFETVMSGTYAKIVENKLAFSRAFVVPRVMVLPGLKELETFMLTSDAKVLKSVVPITSADVAAFGGEEVFASFNLPNVVTAPAKVETIRNRGDYVTLTVSGDEPGILVLTQNFHRGWRATVDGTEVPIIPVYHTFQGIPVPGGKHHVELRFSDDMFDRGLSVAGAVLALLILILVFPLRRRKAG